MMMKTYLKIQTLSLCLLISLCSFSTLYAAEAKQNNDEEAIDWSNKMSLNNPKAKKRKRFPKQNTVKKQLGQIAQKMQNKNKLMLAALLKHDKTDSKHIFLFVSDGGLLEGDEARKLVHGTKYSYHLIQAPSGHIGLQLLNFLGTSTGKYYNLVTLITNFPPCQTCCQIVGALGAHNKKMKDNFSKKTLGKCAGALPFPEKEADMNKFVQQCIKNKKYFTEELRNKLWPEVENTSLTNSVPTVAELFRAESLKDQRNLVMSDNEEQGNSTDVNVVSTVANGAFDRNPKDEYLETIIGVQKIFSDTNGLPIDESLDSRAHKKKSTGQESLSKSAVSPDVMRQDTTRSDSKQVINKQMNNADNTFPLSHNGTSSKHSDILTIINPAKITPAFLGSGNSGSTQQEQLTSAGDRSNKTEDNYDNSGEEKGIPRSDNDNEQWKDLALDIASSPNVDGSFSHGNQEINNGENTFPRKSSVSELSDNSKVLQSGDKKSIKLSWDWSRFSKSSKVAGASVIFLLVAVSCWELGTFLKAFYTRHQSSSWRQSTSQNSRGNRVPTP